MRIQFGRIHFGVFSTFIELFKQVIWGEIWQLPMGRNATDRLDWTDSVDSSDRTDSTYRADRTDKTDRTDRKNIIDIKI